MSDQASSSSPTALVSHSKDPSEKHQRRFYAATILLNELNKAYIENRVLKNTGDIVSREDPEAVELFQEFVCRLAQICDSRPGGATVTAFAVLRRPGGIEYVFASNARRPIDLSTTIGYVQGILRRLGDMIHLSETQHREDAQNELLFEILVFTRDRIKSYITALSEAIHVCLDQQGSSTSDLHRQSLSNLYDSCLQISSGLDEDQYYQIVISILKALQTYYNSGTPSFVLKMTLKSDPQARAPWKSIRHNARRLISFQRAVETLVKTVDMFPELWKDAKPIVIGVPSSTKRVNPMTTQTSSSAAEIVKREFANPEADRYCDLLYRVESHYYLNDKIAEQWESATFRPIIHVEVLLLHWIQKTYGTTADNFFNSWRYIGCSKPTCRLCHEYFTNNPSGVEVRSPHPNLYLNWRIPDSVDEVESPPSNENGAHRATIFRALTEGVMKEVVRVLNDKYPETRDRDSATISSFIPRPAMVSSVPPPPPPGPPEFQDSANIVEGEVIDDNIREIRPT